jgi:hypothetical protein
VRRRSAAAARRQAPAVAHWTLGAGKRACATMPATRAKRSGSIGERIISWKSLHDPGLLKEDAEPIMRRVL